MAEEMMIDERIISGKGIIKIPSAARKLRYYRLFMDVIREPTNKYGNFQWNPVQSLYCRFAYRRDGYVQTYDEMKFNREERRYIIDPPGQTLIAVKCAYAGVLQSFVNLVGGLGGTPGGVGIFVTSVDNLIENFQTLQLSWDEVLFSCYADTALQVRLFGCDYDYCEDDPAPPNDPPPPPPPRMPVPPGTPIIDISPGYDGNDDGNTDPFVDDDFEVPPELPGEECTAYTLRLRVFSDGYGDPTPGYFDYTFQLYAPIFIEIRDEGFPNRVYTISRGGYPGGGCLPDPVEDLVINLGTFTTTGVEVLEFSQIFG